MSLPRFHTSIHLALRRLSLRSRNQESPFQKAPSPLSFLKPCRSPIEQSQIKYLAWAFHFLFASLTIRLCFSPPKHSSTRVISPDRPFQRGVSRIHQAALKCRFRMSIECGLPLPESRNA